MKILQNRSGGKVL